MLKKVKVNLVYYKEVFFYFLINLLMLFKEMFVF